MLGLSISRARLSPALGEVGMGVRLGSWEWLPESLGLTQPNTVESCCHFWLKIQCQWRIAVVPMHKVFKGTRCIYSAVDPSASPSLDMPPLSECGTEKQSPTAVPLLPQGLPLCQGNSLLRGG